MKLPVLSDPSCTRCKLHELTSKVCIAGDGPIDSEVMIVGEAPGRMEEETGKPFMGRAGRLLRDGLEEAGISEAYITNAVSCRPPENRTPKKTEINACSHWLRRRIEALEPKFVLLLGNVPLLSITGEGGITKRRGRPFESGGTIYLPTYHPAYVLRDDRALPAFKTDLRLFAEIIRKKGIPREEGLNYTIVDSDRLFRRMLDDITGTVSFDTETTGLYPWDRGELKLNPKYPQSTRVRGVVSLGIGTKNHQWCLPVTHPGLVADWYDIRRMMEQLSKRLENCFLVGHNGKFDSLWIRRFHKQDWRADFDTMLAHYLVDENCRHDLKFLSQMFYGAPDYNEDVKLKTGEAGTIEEHCLYLAHDVYYTRKLRFTLGKLLAEDPGIEAVFDHILMPCAQRYVDIEYVGVPIDVKRMEEAESYLRDRIATAEKELKQYGEISWTSPKQVAELLFVKLKIKPTDRTPKGAPSTSESALKQIDHPCVGALLRLRGARQQLSFFIEGWKPFLVRGRLHPSFKLHGTVTGRPSCEHPNLQQVPRDALIRSLISSSDDEWEIVEGDLSQVEMRVAAELSGDQTLLVVFDRDEDVHWMTAVREIGRAGAYSKEVLATAAKFSKLSKLTYGQAIDILYKMGPEVAESLDKSWKDARKKAKAVNFGYLFGMWWKKFKIYARDNYGVEVSDEQAQESRKAFFALYSALEAWHTRQRRFAQRNGYVRSLTGRKRRLPAAMSQDDTPARAEAQRQAINSPVQSFASDLNLMVLLQLIEEFGEDIRPIGTVHDAIMMEVRKHLVQTVALRYLEIVKKPKLFDTLGIKLRVPLKGDIKVGPWGKGVSLEKWLASTQPKAKSMPGVGAGKSITTATSKSSSRDG